VPPVSTTKPARGAASDGPLVLIWGEDEFAVKTRAKQLYVAWCQEAGGMDHELIDGAVSNSGEALKAVAKLREALQTLPFFGGSKVVWLQNCNFFGEERVASAQAVTAVLAELAEELKAFRWEGVKLLISGGKVDKRRIFYKTIEKIGSVEGFAGLSTEDKDWADQAEVFARKELTERKKIIDDEACSELVVRVGPNLRLLASEIEKLSLFVGARVEIILQDVDAIVTRQKHARAFALGDALGDRDLPRLLRTLDNELWEMRTEKDRSVIGLLYGLITKVRVLLFLKELAAQGLLKQTNDFSRFKQQLEKIPAEVLPEDRKYSPLGLNPYVLFRALPQATNYQTEELVEAMDLLLRCNQRLVSSSLDDATLLQQTLVSIVSRAGNPVTSHRGTR
jgi:DNA polymerase-3 subunit delta